MQTYCTCLPIPWLIKGRRVPHNFWELRGNRILFMEWLKVQLNITENSQWYRVTVRSVYEKGGGGLIRNRFNDSLYRMLCDSFPHIQWFPWKFPNGFSTRENCRCFLVYVAQLNKISSLDQWYQVNSRDIINLGGESLLLKYDGFLYNALTDLFPTHAAFWKPWLFDRVPKKFWDSLFNQNIYLKWIAEEFHVLSMSDWHGVTNEQVIKFGGAALIHRYGSLSKLLSNIYTSHSFHSYRMLARHPRSSESKSQLHLKRLLYELFEEEANKEENYNSKRFMKDFEFQSMISEERKKVFTLESNVRNILVRNSHKIPEYSIGNLNNVTLKENLKDKEFSRAASISELDLFSQSLSIAFEYQGRSHFHWHHIYGYPNAQKNRDEKKKQDCARLGITLLEVPYWWNGKPSSLVEMIRMHRPDLLLHCLHMHRESCSKPIGEFDWKDSFRKLENLCEGAIQWACLISPEKYIPMTS